MKQIVLTAVILLFISFYTSAQFVGDGAAKPAPAVGTTGKLTFFVKFGAAMPISPFSTTPQRSSNPQFLDGIMGAKTGFFTEFGMGMSLTNPDKAVGFYYFPIMVSYLQTNLDWSDLGGFFSDKNIYSKPFGILDIAQRYGIAVKPVDDLCAALYYRPGLIIPFKYEIGHESGDESFLFTGEMATDDDTPVFMMSHTAGISIAYKMVTISVERYSAKPTFDIIYKDMGVSPSMNVNINTTGKIPLKLLLISLAVSF